MLPKSLEKCIHGRRYFLKPPLHWVQDFQKTNLVFRSQPVRGGPNLLEGLLVESLGSFQGARPVEQLAALKASVTPQVERTLGAD